MFFRHKRSFLGYLLNFTIVLFLSFFIFYCISIFDAPSSSFLFLARSYFALLLYLIPFRMFVTLLFAYSSQYTIQAKRRIKGEIHCWPSALYNSATPSRTVASDVVIVLVVVQWYVHNLHDYRDRNRYQKVTYNILYISAYSFSSSAHLPVHLNFGNERGHSRTRNVAV